MEVECDFRKDKANFVSTYNQICTEYVNKEKEWIKNLRAAGFKAAHPNDGWVDRKNYTVIFVYPQFDDGAGVGDIIMLGRATDKLEEQLPVKLIDTIDLQFSKRFKFVDI